MSDLIERDKVIEYCLKLIDVERKQGSDVMNYGQERINQTDTIIAFVENLPSARPKGEWTSVLTELHERFDALEKEIRKASAEMSAIIRTNLDRPKGEWVWNENGMDWGIGCWCCSECGMRSPYIGSGDTALLSNPHNWAGSKYCPNCGADMRERKDFQVIVNGNCTICGKPLSGNRIFICEECEEQSNGIDWKDQMWAEAVEQNGKEQTMRIIDADRLMQRIKHKLCISSFDYLMDSEKAIVNVIESEPSVEMPTWIPCSERLPEEREWIGTELFGTTISDEVLVTFESQGKRFVKPMHFQNGELGGMDKQEMDAIYGEWKVVAWMSLPEPWKGAD